MNIYFCNYNSCQTKSKNVGKSCSILARDNKTIPEHGICSGYAKYSLGRCYPQFNYTCNDSPYFMPCTPLYILTKSLPPEAKLVKKYDCPAGFR